MSRLFFHVISLFLLFTIQVSFIHSLPYPFDRIPLVVITTVYLYQYANKTSMWWWLICYGFVLDILSISQAPLEVLSYGLASGAMILLVSHVFTNRSFYGMAASALLSLLVLGLSELMILGVGTLFSSPFFWKQILLTQGWAMLFASLLLLFVFPSLRRVRTLAQRLLFKQI